MPNYAVNLKHASAVLHILPKEMQDIMQFVVVSSRRSQGTYLFDANALLVAKVASCLEDYLGTRMSVLSRLKEAFLVA